MCYIITESTARVEEEIAPNACDDNDECPGKEGATHPFGCGGSKGTFRVYPATQTMATKFDFTAESEVRKIHCPLFICMR